MENSEITSEKIVKKIVKRKNCLEVLILFQKVYLGEYTGNYCIGGYGKRVGNSGLFLTKTIIQIYK